MPRQPAVPHNLIRDGLLDADIFKQNGQLKKYNDKIWSELCRDIGLKMTPTSLYLYVYKNIENCKTKIMMHKNMNVVIHKTFKKNYDPDFQIYNLRNPHKKPVLNFQIIFDEEEWMKISPYYRNNQKKLKKGWNSIVYNKMFTSKGIRCSYKFPIVSVTGTLDKFDISFNGECIECHTGISGELFKIKSEDGNTSYGFNLKTFAVQKLYHSKKRRLAFKERREAQVILENKFAAEYREDIQNERMHDLSYEPANLHNVAVYEKARQEIRNEKLGYTESMVLTDISVIKKTSIRKLCLNPFHVFYWTEKQVLFWNKICDLNLPLSLDATGGLFKSTIFKDTKSHSLLYYALVVGIEDSIVPVMQFITAAHHVPAIEEALSFWIEESGARIPKSISTDGSGALQHAVSLVFNKLTFTEYNLVCYKYLTGMPVELPACLYKSDTPHLLRTLNKWICFNSSEPDIILFYKRCVAFMTKIKTLDEFEKVTLALVTVSQSPVVPVGSKCEENLHFLEDVIQTHKCKTLQKEIESQILEKNKIYPELKHGKVVNVLVTYIDGIFKEAKLNAAKYDKATRPLPNPYCVKDFRKNFKSLCYKFPSWTDVMMETYDVQGENINSARSETFFRKRKGQIQRPINIVKYLLYDILKADSYVNRDYVSVRFRKVDEKNPENIGEQNVFGLPLKS